MIQTACYWQALNDVMLRCVLSLLSGDVLCEIGEGKDCSVGPQDEGAV